MSRTLVISLCLALALTSCSNTCKTKVTRAFPNVAVPSVYTAEEDILKYLGMSWWNSFLSREGNYLCDSTHVAGVSEKEIASKLTEYCDILAEVSVHDAGLAGSMMTSFFDKVEEYQKADSTSNVFETFRVMIDTYLYDPNSPIRNESLYHFWAARMAESPLAPDSLRVSYSYDAKRSKLNMAGEKAKDVGGLYSSKVSYKILAFVNYGCHACSEMKETLGTDEVAAWMKDGKLEIIDVYADDIPDSLYDVRAIPSLYLIGPDNRVVFKDIPETRLTDYLRRIL